MNEAWNGRFDTAIKIINPRGRIIVHQLNMFIPTSKKSTKEGKDRQPTSSR